MEETHLREEMQIPSASPITADEEEKQAIGRDIASFFPKKKYNKGDMVEVFLKAPETSPLTVLISAKSLHKVHHVSSNGV